ncbi:hypothetical protein ABZ914_29570 [Spirillospora sp. NPDC046719]
MVRRTGLRHVLVRLLLVRLLGLVLRFRLPVLVGRRLVLLRRRTPLVRLLLLLLRRHGPRVRRLLPLLRSPMLRLAVLRLLRRRAPLIRLLLRRRPPLVRLLLRGRPPLVLRRLAVLGREPALLGRTVLRGTVLGSTVLRRLLVVVLGRLLVRLALLRREAAVLGSAVLRSTVLGRAAVLWGTVLGGAMLWSAVLRRALVVPARTGPVAAPRARQVGPAAQAEQIALLVRLVTDRTVQGRHDTSPERTPARSSLDVRCSMSPLRGIPM